MLGYAILCYYITNKGIIYLTQYAEKSKELLQKFRIEITASAAIIFMSDKKRSK